MTMLVMRDDKIAKRIWRQPITLSPIHMQGNCVIAHDPSSGFALIIWLEKCRSHHRRDDQSDLPGRHPGAGTTQWGILVSTMRQPINVEVSVLELSFKVPN